jgi:hypothetical protein
MTRLVDPQKMKLTPTQERVMKWLSQGWDARVCHGSVVEVNGKRICTLMTVNALERLGLVQQDPSTRCWEATPMGRQLSPKFRDSEEVD